ncbi:NAD(P)-binding domain-containing protein [Acuticoccus sp. M5D2P5]|uniref:L-threonate dehydrogenase n=1 Tax=Acuticoccus kalidii TaxID=2910977 RepID=UPI001F19CC96|nr:L-threonate dehydrogenase [Acuticoccus kalidii]MCF3933480.1 NAD(P)-binding domain-containing protein [Acuticoccus kalidii]
MTKKRVALIGLGSMGGGMARVLVKAGFAVNGFDVDPAREAEFAKESGEPADPAAIGEADIVVVVVVNAAQTEDVLFGGGRFGETGIVGALKADAVVVSCATVSPDFARAMAERVGADRYLDAPISGGSVRAASGELSVLASGTPEAFRRADPAIEAMSANLFRLGDAAGIGSAMKVVNQLLAGVHIAAAAEAITFGMSQGLEPGQIVSVINDCAGNSWMLQNRGPHIRDGDYTPHSAVDIFVKDLGLVEDIARDARFAAPIAGAALQQFLAASGSGLGREDDAAVAKVYARNAGLTLPGDDA